MDSIHQFSLCHLQQQIHHLNPSGEKTHIYERYSQQSALTPELQAIRYFTHWTSVHFSPLVRAQHYGFANATRKLQRFHRESIPPPQPSLPTFPAPPFPGWLLLLFSPLLPSLLPLPRTHSPAASSPPYAAISSSITLALPRPARQTSLPALPLALHGYPLRGPGLVGDSASPPGLHRLIDL